jgi:hypothetical protein
MTLSDIALIIAATLGAVGLTTITVLFEPVVRAARPRRRRR